MSEHAGFHNKGNKNSSNNNTASIIIKQYETELGTHATYDQL